MSKLDKDFLQKNRFWMLLAVALALWAVGLATVMVGPASSASAERKKYEASEKKFKGGGPLFNDRFILPWNEQRDRYARMKNQVWEQAWKPQQHLMTLPDGLKDKYPNPFFGKTEIDPVDLERYQATFYKTQFYGVDGKLNRAVFLGTRDVYLPVEFNDEKILHPITWESAPTNEEFWLAQEELWLRREMLSLVQKTVQLAGKFTQVRERDWDRSPAALQTAGGGGLEYAVRRSPKFFRDRALTQAQKDANVVKSRLFRNHNWEVELLIETGGKAISAQSKITNINPEGRSLSLTTSSGQGLQLRVRQGASSATIKRIEGQLLQRGGWALFGKPTEFDGTGIRLLDDFELEEVFEGHDSPIRRIEEVAIGKPALSHRQSVQLPGLEARASASAPAGTGGTTGSTPGGVSPPPVGQAGGFGAGGGVPAQPGLGAPNATTGGTGENKAPSTLTPNKIDRNRYVVQNETVRRVPVAIVVVMDQSQRNALLTALANSTLRIQTTQVAWRHREPLTAEKKKNESGTGGATVGGTGGVTGVGGTGGTGEAAKLAEGNRNLIELTVCGVATLYERYKAPPPAPGTTPIPGQTPPGVPPLPTVPMPVVPGRP
jgi:hypothetical protein